jgi:hypothetical protein
MTAVPPLDEQKEWYKSLRTEYQVAMEYAIHCTELTWQVGSILIGGSLAAVALSLTTNAKIPIALVTSGAIVAIIAWFLFQRRNGNFAAIATDRMITIEQWLRLGLHTTSRYGARQQVPPNPHVPKPSGHVTAAFLAVGLVLVLSLLVVYVLIFG